MVSEAGSFAPAEPWAHAANISTDDNGNNERRERVELAKKRRRLARIDKPRE